MSTLLVRFLSLIQAHDTDLSYRQEYSTGSSLSTRRLHFQNTEGHMEAYLAAVQKYGFENKLPQFLEQKANDQRIVNAQRVPFSMTAFREQLVKVFVSNDLVCYFLAMFPL
jgi:hypothetical protein